MKEKTFEKSDWYKGSEAFGEHVKYFDNLDRAVQEKNLINFVCKMPLQTRARRALIKSIKAPVD